MPAPKRRPHSPAVSKSRAPSPSTTQGGQGGDLALAFTPQGHLRIREEERGPGLADAVAERVRGAFTAGEGAGVLHLGAAEATTALPPSFAFVRELGGRFVGALRSLDDVDRRIAAGEVPDVAEVELERLARAVPPMTGAEYVTAEATMVLNCRKWI